MPLLEKHAGDVIGNILLWKLDCKFKNIYKYYQA